MGLKRQEKLVTDTEVRGQTAAPEDIRITGQKLRFGAALATSDSKCAETPEGEEGRVMGVREEGALWCGGCGEGNEGERRVSAGICL